MKLIDINNQIGVKFLLYPDNQPHVNIDTIVEGETVNVICSVDNSLTLLHLLQVADALDTCFASKAVLHIPYLMGARFDRVMQTGDSFDLRVIAELINFCNFKKVVLYDVHSDVSTALIKNSVNISNKKLVETYAIPDSILICPDAGAVKKVSSYLKWNNNIVDVVYCVKSRNLATGELTIKVLEPERCKDKRCIIIDDLCDGGGTFIGIAEQIEPSYLTLCVTHGVFSKGFKTLEKHYNSIIVANTYRNGYDSSIVKIVDILN